MNREAIDAVFITTYPIYTAAIGPLLKRFTMCRSSSTCRIRGWEHGAAWSAVAQMARLI
jgi:hypothetical protein